MGNLVLVVDDSKTVCMVVEITLRREGYEVVCCESAESAIDWLKSPSGRVPDLLLSDIQFPKMDGYTFIRLFHSQKALCRVPVVILSRCDGWVDRLKGKLLGASDYLAKPFKTSQLLSIVQTYLGVPVLR